MRIILPTILAAMLISCAGTAPPPSWIESQPLDNANYLGIGIVEKAGKTTEEYRGMARNLAHDEIAGQLKVEVQSAFTSQVTEDNTGLREQVDYIAQTRTNMILKGVETVEFWEDDFRYAVLMRLSKAGYEAQKRQLYDNALTSAMGDAALAERVDRPAVEILKDRLRAYAAISDVQDLFINYDPDGSTREFMKAQESASLLWFAELKLTSSQEALEWVIPRGLEKPLELTVGFMNSTEENTTLPQFPLVFQSGDNPPQHLQTNDQGQVILHSHDLGEITDHTSISIQPDLEKLLGEAQLSPALKGLILPEKRLPVAVRGPRIHVDAYETAMGKALTHSYIAAPVKKILEEEVQAEFVENMNADFQVIIKVSSRSAGPPSQVYGKTIYKAFADLELQIMDRASGEEFWTHSLKDVQGAGFTGEDAASQKALETLAERFQEELRQDLVDVFLSPKEDQ